MIIISLLLLALLVVIYDYYVHHNKIGQLINLIPGPPRFPIIGNILMFQGSSEHLWKIHNILYDEYYPISRVWMLFNSSVQIRHPDDVEIVLGHAKHIDKSELYNILHPWFGGGLLVSQGMKWQTRRKILTPAFHFNILQLFVDVFIEESDRMVQSLKNDGEAVVKDLRPFISKHTLNIICETAMGTSLQDHDTTQKCYREAVYQMSQLIVHRLVRPWLYMDLLFALSPTGRKQKKLLKILHGFTEKIIAERKLYHERTDGRYLKNFKNNEATEIDDDELIGIKKKRLALLDLLIAASKESHITDLDIREEVDTFMFEGHDTIATAVIFALLLLAEHKDIQERVRVEVKNVMEENGNKFTKRSLQNLPYLERCLKESLRLFPSVYFISRITSEDIKLQSYLIPAETTVNISIYNIHRDPNLWPNPNVYDPDRFLPERFRNNHIYSYIPFSAGSRNCIGQKFAMLEMKAIIASLVHNFHLEPVDHVKDLQFKSDLVIRPKNPIRVRFIPIKDI